MRDALGPAFLALTAFSGAALGQTPSATPAVATAPVVIPEQHDASGATILPVHTEVPLAIDQELASKGHQVGDTFSLKVTRDVMVGSTVVIPKGTPATGKITERSGKGTLGKSAKMTVAMTSLALNGRVVPLSGDSKRAGKGNGAATLGTLLLFGPLAAGITGTSARYKAGTAFTAYTAEPILVGQPAPVPTAAPGAG